MYYSSHPQQVNTGILRVIIPDGWLVITADGPIIVPDPSHSWQTTNLLPAGTCGEMMEAPTPQLEPTPEPTQEELDRQAEDQRRRAWAERCVVIQRLCALTPVRHPEIWAPIALDPATGKDRYIVGTAEVRHPLIAMSIDQNSFVKVPHGDGYYDHASVRPWDGWLPVAIVDEIEAMISWAESSYSHYVAAAQDRAAEKQRAHEMAVQAGVWATAMKLEDLKAAQQQAIDAPAQEAPNV